MVNEEQAHWRLIRANEEIARALTAFSNRQFQQAFSQCSNARETIRLLLEVDRDITAEDKDE